MKRAPPSSTLDYRLRITPLFNEREQRYKTKFVLETTQSFASFVYDLSVKEQLKGTHIHLKVLGLKPPQLSIPAAGHARFEREYDDLNGTYDVTIEGIDGRTNTFTLRVASNKVEQVRAPREKFTELILGTRATSKL